MNTVVLEAAEPGEEQQQQPRKKEELERRSAVPAYGSCKHRLPALLWMHVLFCVRLARAFLPSVLSQGSQHFSVQLEKKRNTKRDILLTSKKDPKTEGQLVSLRTVSGEVMVHFLRSSVHASHMFMQSKSEPIKNIFSIKTIRARSSLLLNHGRVVGKSRKKTDIPHSSSVKLWKHELLGGIFTRIGSQNRTENSKAALVL